MVDAVWSVTSSTGTVTLAVDIGQRACGTRNTALSIGVEASVRWVLAHFAG